MLNSNVLKTMVHDFFRTVSKREYSKIISIEISSVSIKDGENNIEFMAKSEDSTYYYCATVLNENIANLKLNCIPVYTISSISCLKIKSSEKRIVVYAVA